MIIPPKELSKRIGKIYNAFASLCRIIIKPERIANTHHLKFLTSYSLLLLFIYYYHFFFKQTPEATFIKVTYDLQMAKSDYFFLAFIPFDLCKIYIVLTFFLKLISLDFSNSTFFFFLVQFLPEMDPCSSRSQPPFFFCWPPQCWLALFYAWSFLVQYLPGWITFLQLDLCLSINSYPILSFLFFLYLELQTCVSFGNWTSLHGCQSLLSSGLCMNPAHGIAFCPESFSCPTLFLHPDTFCQSPSPACSHVE